MEYDSKVLSLVDTDQSSVVGIRSGTSEPLDIGSNFSHLYRSFHSYPFLIDNIDEIF